MIAVGWWWEARRIRIDAPLDPTQGINSEAPENEGLMNNGQTFRN
jgi:hypothetical protein